MNEPKEMPKEKNSLSFIKRKKLNIERLIKCGSLKNSAVINLITRAKL